MNESPIGPGEGVRHLLVFMRICVYIWRQGHRGNCRSSASHFKHSPSGPWPPSTLHLCLSLSLCGCYGLNRNFNSPLVTAPINGHDSKSSRGHALVPAQNLNCEYICHPPSPRERDVGKRKQREMEGEERKVALRIFEEIKGGLRFVNQVN